MINLDHPNICRYLDIEEIEKENGFGEKELTQICVMELFLTGEIFWNTIALTGRSRCLGSWSTMC